MDREERKKRRKRRERKKVLLTVCVCFALAGGFTACRDIRGMGQPDQGFVVEIPEGAGTTRIAAILEECEAIRHPVLFQLYARLLGEPLYQKGKHTINPAEGYGGILKSLTAPPDINDSIKKVVIPEGYELRQIVDLLTEQGLGEREAFLAEIETGEFGFDFVAQIPPRENRLEGYLYPDTYLFSVEESEHEILQRMLENFQERVVPVYGASGTTYSLDQILILASVVEREAANDKERPLVASVFHNRLERGMKLESCATVQYILKERKTVLSNADTAIDSPYNTYQNQGLPAGPIASPGLSSVQAVLAPADTDYLYFVAEADGSRNWFSETFAEHNQKTKEIQG